MALERSEAWGWLRALGWIDLGSHPKWSPGGAVGTCRVRQTARLARRDYVLAAPAAACRILSFA
eukprot:5176441-Alexandrium_andersonii.AAC.1